MANQIEQIKLKTRWQTVGYDNYPPKDFDEFYGDRYSLPVLAGNETTGQVSQVALMWDYECGGWIPVTMEDGPDSCEYETQHVSHWALWPTCNLIHIDGNVAE